MIRYLASNVRAQNHIVAYCSPSSPGYFLASNPYESHLQNVCTPLHIANCTLNYLPVSTPNIFQILSVFSNHSPPTPVLNKSYWKTRDPQAQLCLRVLSQILTRATSKFEFHAWSSDSHLCNQTRYLTSLLLLFYQ